MVDSVTFQIIQATTAHLDTLVPLFDGYRIFYKQPSDEAAARDYLQARLDNDEAVVYLALDSEQRGLGFTLLYPTFSSIGLRRVWILNDLYVTPDARRLGVARALMDRARQLGTDTAARALMLSTAVDNIPAQTLYEAQGWQRDTQFFTYWLRL